MPLRPHEDRVGTVLAEKYELTRVLGEGGMGVVYEGVHKWTARRVAVKLLQPLLASNPETGRRFLQEARSASAIEHPNVVQVLDMGSDDGTAYLVLELLVGEPLARRLERGPLPLSEVLDVLLPVMSALATAHDKRLIHRDLKPENIFLAEQAGERIPKVLDFGLAKVVQNDSDGRGTTRTGAVLGTPYYLAPEQALADPTIGIAADVWAIGVVLYECLTQRVPFPGGSVTAVLLSVCHSPPVPADELPPELAAVVLRALEKRPADRYGDMRAFAAALVEVAQRSGVTVELPKGLHPAGGVVAATAPIATLPDPSPPAGSLPASSRAPRALLALAAVAFALSGLGAIVLAFALFMRGPPEPTTLHVPVQSPPPREPTTVSVGGDFSETAPVAADPAPAEPALPVEPTPEATPVTVDETPSERPRARVRHRPTPRRLDPAPAPRVSSPAPRPPRSRIFGNYKGSGPS